MLKIGLTGSIAAGKSTVADYFVQQGLPLWDADRASRDVVRPGQPALKEIVRAFGTEILREDGALDRAKLGSIIFTDPEKREVLNNIVHPAVFEDMQRCISAARERGEAMILLDIPLLFETNLQGEMDSTCLVYCDDALRLERLIKRDGLTEEEAKKRMVSQMPQSQKRTLADAIIDNSGSWEETRIQAQRLLACWRNG